MHVGAPPASTSRRSTTCSSRRPAGAGGRRRREDERRGRAAPPSLTRGLADQIARWRGARSCAPCASPRQRSRPLVFPLMLLAVNSGGLEARRAPAGLPDRLDRRVRCSPCRSSRARCSSTMNTGTDLARDIQTGFLNRLSLTPMRGVALLAGQLGGVVVLGARPGGRLPGRRPVGRRPASRPAFGGVARPVRCSTRSSALALRRARHARRAAHRLRRGRAGPVPAVLRVPLHLVDGASRGT